jgi:hypothetical protein
MQFMLEIIVFIGTILLSIVLILFLQREKFFHAHVYLSCICVWLLLTFFSILPIIFQQYTSILRFMGIITFSIMTIHTTLPIARTWTMLMALTTSIIHCTIVLRTHHIRDQTSEMHRMQFKLEVNFVDVIYFIDTICLETNVFRRFVLFYSSLFVIYLARHTDI